jgi:hypothetical protein
LKRLLSEIPSAARDPYGLKDLRGQIFPLRIAPGKQRNLLFSSILLDLLFSIGCHCGIGVSLKIHQPVDVVLLGETIKNPGFMLQDSLSQIISQAYVQGSAQAGKDVDEIASLNLRAGC